MTDKDPYPEEITDTTCGCPDEPDHDDVVVGGQSGKDEYPAELLEGIEAVEDRNMVGREEIMEDIDDGEMTDEEREALDSMPTFDEIINGDVVTERDLANSDELREGIEAAENGDVAGREDIIEDINDGKHNDD